MRKVIGLAMLVVALALPTAALAATLENGSSQTCSGTTVWHFVNNQTGGAAAGALAATFDIDGVEETVTVGPSGVNKNTQHFHVTTEGDATLVDAETNLPGRLVLSDFSCDGDKEDPPKK